MKKLLLILVAAVTITACKKGAGEGGNSSVTGTVMASEYDEKSGLLLRTQPGEDVDVYIIYGDDASYGNKTKTSGDGKFEFKYLRRGSYKVYAYSQTLPVSKTSGQQAVIKPVEIVDKKKSVDIGTIEINRKY